LEVVHHTELLARLIDGGALDLDTSAAPPLAAYHDPCYLARFERTSDAPRAVLAAAGFTLSEMPHRRERTLCCGGGAAGRDRGVRSTAPRHGLSGVPDDARRSRRPDLGHRRSSRPFHPGLPAPGNGRKWRP